MESFEITIQLALFLFATGFLAGLVDSIAGGGGLIALPVLLSIGLPPQIALGTNKLQGCFGTFSAACNFVQKKEVLLREAIAGICFTLVGAALGAWLVQQLSARFIEPLVPVLLLGVLVYTFFLPKLGFTDRDPKIPLFFFSMIFGILLGFYDGFFGPGTGSFWTLACMAIMGMNMTKASGYTKIMNFTSNFVALSLFILGGNVFFTVGFIMAFGQVLGAVTGSNLAIKNGASFIRPIFLSVVLLTIARLIYLNVMPVA